MRGQERLRLQFGRTPDSVFCSDPLHPRAARVLLLLLFTVEEHEEKETERERERETRERDEDSGHFCLGLQRACDVRHALSLSIAPPVYTSLSVGGSSTTRTQRSLSVAREPRPEQHGLVVVRSIIAPTDTRSSPPLLLPT